MIRLLRTGDTRLWLLFGLVAGLGLLTKLTMLFFGFGLVVGLLLTPRRSLLASCWLWLGGTLAFAFLLPYLLWNAANGFPTVGFWASYGGKLAGGSLVDDVAQQVLTMNPLTLPLWVTGLWFYLRTKAGRPYRALGWAFVVLFALFALTRAKVYFLSPAYPMLFAAGAVLIERRAARWLRPAYAVALVACGIALAPVAMPILPPPTWGQIYGFMGGDAGVRMENHATAILPQWLADRFGWDTLAASVARADARLTPAEQVQACVIAGNYGEAAALEFYGPAPISSGARTAATARSSSASASRDPTSQASSAASSRSKPRPASTACPTRTTSRSTSYHLPPAISGHNARQPKLPIRQAWPGAKHFD